MIPFYYVPHDEWVFHLMPFIVLIGRVQTAISLAGEKKMIFVYFGICHGGRFNTESNQSIHINVISFAAHTPKCQLISISRSLSLLHLSFNRVFCYFSMDFIFNVSLIYLFQLWRLLLLWFFGLYIWVSIFLFIQRRFTLIIFGCFFCVCCTLALRECEHVRVCVWVCFLYLQLKCRYLLWPTNCNASVFDEISTIVENAIVWEFFDSVDVSIVWSSIYTHTPDVFEYTHNAISCQGN